MVNEEYEALLDRWAEQPHHKRRCFIRDGILNPELWANAPLHVVFLMREAYGENPHAENWDLRKYVQNEPPHKGSKLSKTLGYWAHVIFGHPVAPIPSPAQARCTFLHTAQVNVKKSGGTSRSSMHEIAEFARVDSALLRDQLSLLSPDIVVGGNLGECIRIIWPAATRVSERGWLCDGIPFYDFRWHPANRYSYERNYKEFASAWAEYRKFVSRQP